MTYLRDKSWVDCISSTIDTDNIFDNEVAAKGLTVKSFRETYDKMIELGKKGKSEIPDKMYMDVYIHVVNPYLIMMSSPWNHQPEDLIHWLYKFYKVLLLKYTSDEIDINPEMKKMFEIQISFESNAFPGRHWRTQYGWAKCGEWFQGSEAKANKQFSDENLSRNTHIMLMLHDKLTHDEQLKSPSIYVGTSSKDKMNSLFNFYKWLLLSYVEYEIKIDKSLKDYFQMRLLFEND